MNEDRLTPWQPGSVLIGRGTSSASQLLTGLAATKANAAISKMMYWMYNDNNEDESPFITGSRYIVNHPQTFDPNGRSARLEQLRQQLLNDLCRWNLRDFTKGGYTGPRNFGGPVGGGPVGGGPVGGGFYDGGFVRGPEE